jgi:AcrR family transcriptional regulator
MSKMNLKEGRVQQKLSTRNTIIETAKSLLISNPVFSLEDVAKASNISRATIYRYFSNVDVLRMEASLAIKTKSAEEILEGKENESIGNQILAIQNYFNDLATDHEASFRMYLSVVLKESSKNLHKVPNLRGARRVDALEETLQALKSTVSPKDLNNLKTVASVLMGIEAVVVTKDVCQLNEVDAKKALNWGIQMILKGMNVNE